MSGSNIAYLLKECVDYSGCDEGLPVRWCVHQSGHNWPGFAPQAIWDFFSSL
jgi:hypothetical protein